MRNEALQQTAAFSVFEILQLARAARAAYRRRWAAGGVARDIGFSRVRHMRPRGDVRAPPRRLCGHPSSPKFIGKARAGEPDHNLVWLSPPDAMTKLPHESQRWAVSRAYRRTCSIRASISGVVGRRRVVLHVRDPATMRERLQDFCHDRSGAAGKRFLALVASRDSDDGVTRKADRIPVGWSFRFR